MNKPNFIVVGAQRCGTTWLYENLSNHPEVYMSEEKELNFFSDLNDNKFSLGEPWYFSNFDDANNVKCIGEITPEYLVCDLAYRRIKKTLGAIKIIVIVRNPLDRIVSSYKRGLREGDWDVSFDEYVSQSMDYCIDRSLYAKDIKKYIDEFGAEQVKILLYDDIYDNPKFFLEELYGFLNISTDIDSRLADKKFNIGISNKTITLRISLLIRDFLYKFQFGKPFVKSIQRTSFGNFIMSRLLKSPPKKALDYSFDQNLIHRINKSIDELFEILNDERVLEWKK